MDGVKDRDKYRQDKVNDPASGKVGFVANDYIVTL